MGCDSPPYSPLTPPQGGGGGGPPSHADMGSALSMLASMLKQGEGEGDVGQPGACSATQAGTQGSAPSHAGAQGTAPSHADEEGMPVPDLSPSGWREHMDELPEDLVVSVAEQAK